MLGVLDQPKTLAWIRRVRGHFAFGNDLRQMPTALGWRLNPKASLLRVPLRPGSGAACFTF